MTQHETLFEVADPAWRLELRVKFGGGPFDPAGYSIMVTKPSGELVAMEVHKAETERWPMVQLSGLLALATSKLDELLAEAIEGELRDRLAEHRRTVGPTR